LKLISGENRLRAQVIECFFRGSCLGEEEAMARFEQLARRLNHRASLRLVDRESGIGSAPRPDKPSTGDSGSGDS